MKSTTRRRAKLFDAVVDQARQHPAFRQIATSDSHVGARALMQQTFDQWDGPDRHFVHQFQTEGFDARVFELYLVATLGSLGWTVDSESGRPDFRCRGDGLEFYVEAATAHSPGNPQTPTSPEEFFKELEASSDNVDEVAVRFGSVLLSKSTMDYQDLPHVAGKSIVIAVQGFFGPGALFHNALPLVRYLYDVALTQVDASGAISPTAAPVGFHIGDTKTIPSGWFGEDAAAHISAVMWSNCGTTGKFTRMATGLGLGAPGCEVYRSGRELDSQPGATEPKAFFERVEPGSGEPWEEGLVVMHNPRATVPLPLSAFEGVTQIRQVGNTLSFDLRGRQIYNQRTICISSGSEQAEEHQQ